MNKVKRLTIGTAMGVLMGLAVYAVPKAVEAEECLARTYRTGVFCCNASGVIGCIGMNDGTDGNPKGISAFCGGDATQTPNCGNGPDEQNLAWAWGTPWEDTTEVLCEVTTHGETAATNCPENLYQATVRLTSDGY